MDRHEHNTITETRACRDRDRPATARRSFGAEIRFPASRNVDSQDPGTDSDRVCPTVDRESTTVGTTVQWTRDDAASPARVANGRRTDRDAQRPSTESRRAPARRRPDRPAAPGCRATLQSGDRRRHQARASRDETEEPTPSDGRVSVASPPYRFDRRPRRTRVRENEVVRSAVTAASVAETRAVAPSSCPRSRWPSRGRSTARTRRSTGPD